MSREVIRKLLEKYEVKDLLTDEVKVDFNSLKMPHEVYGVPADMPKGYQQGPFNHPWAAETSTHGPDPILFNAAADK